MTLNCGQCFCPFPLVEQLQSSPRINLKLNDCHNFRLHTIHSAKMTTHVPEDGNQKHRCCLFTVSSAAD